MCTFSSKDFSRASDKLEKATITIMKVINDIDIFFDIEDNEPLYQCEGDARKIEYRLAIDDNKITVLRMGYSLAWSEGW
ncbi:MAG: hypothetical protein QXP58_08620, partial [Thermoprotei archaeon]